LITAGGGVWEWKSGTLIAGVAVALVGTVVAVFLAPVVEVHQVEVPVKVGLKGYQWGEVEEGGGIPVVVVVPPARSLLLHRVTLVLFLVGLQRVVVEGLWPPPPSLANKLLSLPVSW